jgi:hypothetical protein
MLATTCSTTTIAESRKRGSHDAEYSMRAAIEMEAVQVLKMQRGICTLPLPPAAAAAAAAAGVKLYAFSGAGHSKKVGSAVLVTATTIKHAFTTSALGMDDNFDKLPLSEGAVDFSSTENFAFGLCKGYLELYKLKALTDSPLDAFKAYVAYNADKKWLSPDDKLMAEDVISRNGNDKDVFLKHLMLTSVAATLKQCGALKKKAEDRREAGDALMCSMLPAMMVSFEAMQQRDCTAAELLVDFSDFKRTFLLDNITKLQPETAKMAIGRSVIYSAIAEEWEGGLSTWAVYFTRAHFLCHHPAIAYTFFMVNAQYGGKEYSKFDDIWAQKYPTPDTQGGGALCDIISPDAATASKCMGFVLGTIDDTSKLLAKANARVVDMLRSAGDTDEPKDAEAERAKGVLTACGWRDAINKATLGDVFNPPPLKTEVAACIATATFEDSCRFVARLSAYLDPNATFE